MDKDHFYHLVSKKLSHSATEEEEKKLSKYLSNDEYRELFAWIKKEWSKKNLEVNTSRFNYQKGFQKVVEGIRKHEPGYRQRSTDSQFSVGYKTIYLRFAAMLLITIGISILAFYTFQKFEKSQIVSSAMIKRNTSKGEHLKIALPDGSKVILNGNSELIYPESFSGVNREVFIKGEGYFEIKKDPEKPFLLIFDKYQLQVLGTKFNVNAYQNNQNIEVSLVEGSVKVGHQDSIKKHMLKPNHQLSIDRKTHQSSLSEFDKKQTIGWKERIFVFDNEPLAEVLGVLENNYSVHFNYEKEKLKNCLVNAEFNDESIWTILEAIRYAAGIDYEIESQTEITLIGTGCK